MMGPQYFFRGTKPAFMGGRTYPAGQADMTFSVADANPVAPDESATTPSTGVPAPPPPSLMPSDLGLTSTPGGGGGGISQAQQQALFSTIGGALNTTGATIASIVASNNQTQIAQLQAQTQQQIATLNAQAQESRAAGNLQLAQQQAQQAAQLQAFNAQYLLNQHPSNVGLYVVGGLVALGLVGAIIYFVRK